MVLAIHSLFVGNKVREWNVENTQELLALAITCDRLASFAAPLF